MKLLKSRLLRFFLIFVVMILASSIVFATTFYYDRCVSMSSDEPCLQSSSPSTTNYEGVQDYVAPGYASFRTDVFLVDSSNNYVNIGSSVMNHDQAQGTEGWHTGSWTPAQRNMHPYDSLVIREVISVGSTSKIFDFKSYALGAKQLASTTWTFRKYTRSEYFPGNWPYVPSSTAGKLLVGGSTNSRVEGISFVPYVSICGDGIKWTDEQCDDGNTNPGDGCSSTCTFESVSGVMHYNKDMHFVNGINGYVLSDTLGTAQGMITPASNLNSDSGIAASSTIYLKHGDGSQTLLGSNVAPVSLFCAYPCTQQVNRQRTWSAPETELDLDDALMIVEKVWDSQNPSNTGSKTFIAERLGGAKLNAGTWTFNKNLYLNKQTSYGYSFYYGYLSFGAAGYDSYIDGISITPPVCGNGVVESGEDCDDGNILCGDSCPGDCLLVEEITETLFYNSLTHTINGVTEKMLSNNLYGVQSSVFAVTDDMSVTTSYFDSDVSILHSDGTESLIGSSVAGTSISSTSGYINLVDSKSWSPPETPMSADDALKIVERVKTKVISTGTFITARLGANRLNSVPWTFKRHIYRAVMPAYLLPNFGSFYFGDSTYDSSILGVSYTVGACTDSDSDGYGVCPDVGIAKGCTYDGEDCDDSDPTIYYGADELCDGKDNDCDGGVDEGCCMDGDSDGFGVCPNCGIANGCTYDGADCVDTNIDVNPSSTEICNGIDDDCDSLIDEGGVCCAPVATDDATCDGVNDDCDAETDEDATDSDSDGACDLVDSCPSDPNNDEDSDGVCGDVDNCDAVANPDQLDFDTDTIGNACDTENTPDDCNDGYDNDGDTLIDIDDLDCQGIAACPICDDCGGSFFDLNTCDYAECTACGGGCFFDPGFLGLYNDCHSCDAILSCSDYPADETICETNNDCGISGCIFSEGVCCTDVDGDGVCVESGDCDDSNPAIFPNAVEACDDIDNDCNGETDEICDVDGDFYCNGDLIIITNTKCDKTDPGLESTYDCDDSNAEINPAADEICDGLDNNCAGDPAIDEVCDLDGDGYCDGGVEIRAGAICDLSSPGDEYSFDCRDDDPNINPGKIELCDNVDQNCRGGPDEICDKDGDGYCDGDLDILTNDFCSLTDPGDESTFDCNDLIDDVHPDADEICNSIDDNCDGYVDDEDGVTDCVFSKADLGEGYITPGKKFFYLIKRGDYIELVLDEGEGIK